MFWMPQQVIWMFFTYYWITTYANWLSNKGRWVSSMLIFDRLKILNKFYICKRQRFAIPCLVIISLIGHYSYPMVPKKRHLWSHKGYCASECGPCWRPSNWERGPFFDFTSRKCRRRTIRVEIKGSSYTPCAVLGFWQTHFPSSVVPFGWCYHGLYDS